MEFVIESTGIFVEAEKAVVGLSVCPSRAWLVCLCKDKKNPRKHRKHSKERLFYQEAQQEEKKNTKSGAANLESLPRQLDTLRLVPRRLSSPLLARVI